MNPPPVIKSYNEQMDYNLNRIGGILKSMLTETSVKLWCGFNQLQQLDIHNNYDLQTLEYSGNLPQFVIIGGDSSIRELRERASRAPTWRASRRRRRRQGVADPEDYQMI